MKKVLMFAVIATALVSCNSNNNRNQTRVENRDTIPTVAQSSATTEQVQVYEGLLPAADGPGIRYRVTLRNNGNMNDGTYSMDMTYLEAENGRDQTFRSSGRIQTMRGSATNPNATVYKLTSNDDNEVTYFLMRDDRTLRLLNENLEEPDSEHNYDIVLIN